MRRRLCLLFLPLAACATGPQFGQGPYQQESGRWGERFHVDAFAVPGIWLQPRQADPANPGRDAPDASGPGLALRGAVGNGDQSIGLFYLGGLLDDDDVGSSVDLHALFLDFDITVPLPDSPGNWFVHAAAGFGMASVTFAEPRFDDLVTGAFNMRLDLEFAPLPQFAALVGVGGFVLGRPGQTDAFGSFFEVGGRFTF